VSGRTGAGRPAAGPPPGREGGAPQTATYRGIRWRKDPDGTIGWLNEGAGGWVRWRPGSDAPPVPPRWEGDAARLPVPPRVRRPSWRSPYRIVPILLVVAAVIIGVVQATHTTQDAAATANREAHDLLGRCLARTGGTAAAPVYGPTAVNCTTSDAAVKVVLVLDAGPSNRCPSGTSVLQLSYVGTRTPDIECVRPVARP
jgi:hypothetical protein